jgi:hypothetical protein
MNGIISACGEFVDKMNRAARPYLTVLVATMFNLLTAWAVVKERLSVQEYITAIAPTNAMIIGFWFGEKAALRSEENPHD